jgi:hypothetical protein
MKKGVIILALLMVGFLQLASAIELEINPVTNDVAMIKGTTMPAIFELNITNRGTADNFIFYDFFGSDSFPKGTVYIGGGESKIVKVGIYPRSDLKQMGRIIFDLYIQGQDGEKMTTPLMVNVVTMDDAFQVGADEFKPDSNTVTVFIKNLINFNFENIDVGFKSPFFSLEKKITLPPYGKETFEVSVNKEDFKELMAGYYTLNVLVNAQNQKTNVQGKMKFAEKNIVTSSQDDYGLIVNTKKILKANEGNVLADSSTVIKKNVISRLFTSFSPEPNIVDRKGLVIYYTWEQQLKPGEQMSITVRTNWLLPLLAILLIISIVIIAKQFTKKPLSMKKSVQFVNAKGGEFALKVSVIISARKYVEKVHIMERLPPLVKLHERFGGEMPKKVDERTGRLEWNFDKLQAGESRIISYIIYSKVGVLGKFALPTTTAVFEKDGEVHEAESNHAFFIADQIKRIED